VASDVEGEKGLSNSGLAEQQDEAWREKIS
jgi:hypothetical protein